MCSGVKETVGYQICSISWADKTLDRQVVAGIEGVYSWRNPSWWRHRGARGMRVDLPTLDKMEALVDASWQRSCVGYDCVEVDGGFRMGVKKEEEKGKIAKTRKN